MNNVSDCLRDAQSNFQRVADFIREHEVKYCTYFHLRGIGNISLLEWDGGMQIMNNSGGGCINFLNLSEVLHWMEEVQNGR